MEFATQDLFNLMTEAEDDIPDKIILSVDIIERESTKQYKSTIISSAAMLKVWLLLFAKARNTADISTKFSIDHRLYQHLKL